MRLRRLRILQVKPYILKPWNPTSKRVLDTMKPQHPQNPTLPYPTLPYPTLPQPTLPSTEAEVAVEAAVVEVAKADVAELSTTAAEV